MRRNYKFGVGALILVSAIAYLVYAGVEQSSIYYFTIGEFLEKEQGLADQGVRVAGRVAAGSVQKKTNATGTELKFTLRDFEHSDDPQARGLAVEYVGVLPDMFAEGRDVIVEGKYVGGTLRAQSVMTSCPSKYEPVPGEAGANPPVASN
jgi:cytochrome c-type biogenesis protein CcmE